MWPARLKAIAEASPPTPAPMTRAWIEVFGEGKGWRDAVVNTYGTMVEAKAYHGEMEEWEAGSGAKDYISYTHEDRSLRERI